METVCDVLIPQLKQQLWRLNLIAHPAQVQELVPALYQRYDELLLSATLSSMGETQVTIEMPGHIHL